MRRVQSWLYPRSCVQSLPPREVRGTISAVQPGDVAESICRRAGVELESPLPVSRLVAACLGPHAVRVATPGTIHGHTKLVRLGNSWRIYVQRGIPAPMETRGVLRHLVEWELIQSNQQDGTQAELVEAAVQILEALVDSKSLVARSSSARKSSPRATREPIKAGGKRTGTRPRRRTG